VSLKVFTEFFYWVEANIPNHEEILNVKFEYLHEPIARCIFYNNEWFSLASLRFVNGSTVKSIIFDSSENL
jgi:hypothetical protein